LSAPVTLPAKPRGGSPGIVWDQQVWSRCDDATMQREHTVQRPDRSTGRFGQGRRPAPEAWSLDGARGRRRRVMSVRWARLTEDDRPTCYESLSSASHPGSCRRPSSRRLCYVDGKQNRQGVTCSIRVGQVGGADTSGG
jgi:hypothetical protein